jgi:hypothetical protein
MCMDVDASMCVYQSFMLKFSELSFNAKQEISPLHSRFSKSEPYQFSTLGMLWNKSIKQ